MKNNGFILRGDIIYATDAKTLNTLSHGFLICENHQIVGVFERIPERYKAFPVKDYGNQLILPGLSDLHVHAPQYAFRGLGMDLELLPWLETYTFPEEAKYSDAAYAAKAYQKFAEDLRVSATTRASVFATLHREGTLLLMDALEASGIKGYVGKVNMDRNGSENLLETTEESLEETRQWLSACQGRYKNLQPILTPRFIPTCSDALMAGLSKIQKDYALPLQSHLSENLSEIQWVKTLHPEASCYGAAYDQYDLFGRGVPTIMAHCVHSTEVEIALMKKNGVFIAHCPGSNMSLCSGAAPVRTYLERQLNMGLGSDIAGGAALSIFAAMRDAIQSSKLRFALKDRSLEPLTAVEAFYLGTKGGGAFFGKVGSFEPGYACDAVVIDDSTFETLPEYGSLPKRLERLIYLSEACKITGKFVGGEELF